MDILYASIKHDIILAIEKSSLMIDFRKDDSFGLCLNKHIYSYEQLLLELNFIPLTEETGLMLFMHKDRNTSPFTNLSQHKETLDKYIMTMERDYV